MHIDFVDKMYWSHKDYETFWFSELFLIYYTYTILLYIIDIINHCFYLF